MARDERRRKLWLALLALVLIVLAFVVGILIGRGINKTDVPSGVWEGFERWRQGLTEGDRDAVTGMILEEMNPEEIRGQLKYFTSRAHLAGTQEERENAEYIKEQWDAQGLDASRIVTYNVLLSYPRRDRPNYVSILLEDDTEVFRTDPEEAELVPGDKLDNAVPPFNAYAKAGRVEGDIVYVNYGRASDFQQLTGDIGVNLTGKIALARYGKGFRGEKARQAHLFGAAGLILYSDPFDYAIYGVDDVYPESMFLPGTGVQRGNIITLQGDPLTQGYPAKDYMYRIPEDEATMPQIPVQPISYDDAETLLSSLGGDEVPADWVGAVPGVTYRIGPGPTENRRVRLEVNNFNDIRPIHNVVGMIRGSIEPDRYVIIGNHRDAWNYGALDPSSGTAAMMEISRTFGKLVKEGKWRPRRSILFISWGAEEYGIMGAYEWIEEFSKTVSARTVAYLNVDIAVSGNHAFKARASPSLHDLIYEVTRKIPDPPDYGETIFESWLKWNPRDGADLPSISTIRTGSDFRPFIMVTGIPCIDIRYDRNMSLGTPSYPLYHTMYETFHFVSTILDPTFRYHLAIARIWAELARSLSDAIILPINCSAYAERIRSGVDHLKELYQEKMANRTEPITFDEIDAQLERFRVAADGLHERVRGLDMNDPFAVRAANDQLMLMERAFIEPRGMPGKPLHRHMVFSPASKDKSYRDTFAVIADAMLDVETSDDPAQAWTEVERYMAMVAFTLDSAATTMMDAGVLAA